MEAALLLQRISTGAAGEPLALGEAEQALLAELVAEGLAEVAPDVSRERAELAGLRDEMRRLAAARSMVRAGTKEAKEVDARERVVRSRILELSAQAARGDGAATVYASAGGGPYRDGAGAALGAYRPTYRGRTVLSELAPRLTRVGAMEVREAESELERLRAALSARAKKAAELVGRLTTSFSGRPELSMRAAAVGLASRNESVDVLAQAFEAVERSLRGWDAKLQAVMQGGMRELAVECICLASPTLPPPEGAANALVALRDWLRGGYSAGREEDAFDAAVVLLGMEPTRREELLAGCVRLASEYNAASRGGRLALAGTLLVVASGAADDGTAAYRIASLASGLVARGTREDVAPSVACVLALVPGDPGATVERFVACRDFLSRFSSDSVGLEPALLSTLAIDVPEILDDVRLAAAEVQRHGLAAGGIESMSLGIKLLLHVAVLAAGREGDPEESLRLAPFAIDRIPALGLPTLATTLPVALASVAAFHLPAFDEAWIRTHSPPTHDSVIFGGSRGYSSGRSWG